MLVSTWRSKSWRRDRSLNRRRRLWSCALLLFPPLALLGQNLQISSAKASRGERVTLQVSLTSPPGQAPVALQWETAFPADQLTPIDGGASLGPIARAAGKTVKCAPKPATGETSGSKCILIGGQQPIHNGVIVRLQFRVLPEAPKGTARVRIDQGMAVFKDLAQSPLNAADAVVRVR